MFLRENIAENPKYAGSRTHQSWKGLGRRASVLPPPAICSFSSSSKEALFGNFGLDKGCNKRKPSNPKEGSERRVNVLAGRWLMQYFVVETLELLA